MAWQDAVALVLVLGCLCWSLAMTAAGSFLYALSRDSVLLFFCQLTPGCLPEQKSVVSNVCERVDVVVVAFGFTSTCVLAATVTMLCTQLRRSTSREEEEEEKNDEVQVLHGHHPSISSMRRNIANADLSHPCTVECTRMVLLFGFMYSICLYRHRFVFLWLHLVHRLDTYVILRSSSIAL